MSLNLLFSKRSMIFCYYPDNIFWILVTKIEPSRRFFEGKSRLSPHLTYTSHYYNSTKKVLPLGGRPAGGCYAINFIRTKMMAESLYFYVRQFNIIIM